MTAELDTHWGAHPVDFAAFRSAYARDVAGRRACRRSRRVAPAALPRAVDVASTFVAKQREEMMT